MFKKRARPTSVRDKANVENQEESKRIEGESEPGTPGTGEEDETGQTIEDLVLLRKLRKSQAQQGIDLEKLNRGEQAKKGKNKKKELDAGEKYGLQAGPSRGGEEKDDEGDEKERAKRLVRTNNFTQQTNALDVDKHMMAYIEAELAKKRGEAIADDNTKSGVKEAFDPQAELYKIAEKYKVGEKTKKTNQDDEGNVTNSLGMLTSIPEVDLGMDNRLRNIEMTEKAKREMLEHRKAAAADAAEREKVADDYAAARFHRPHQRVASDIYAIQEARRAEAGLAPRTESATDEQVYERFKKR
ncbi:uncharacterized protein I303_103561 [Kwoniella dejecticola CBS 10117]|uniref:Uncharacterized protein n=1 Tax=Kwoniella dejecticola CBS 10117 TaxID=1296121 RepID=A0A1A6A736_9TREE|nr:uncharacterized protein I303_03583 [Kwoniella dejecticola CBS 10117]OBR85869.1 hypothetical protein I303_03583 [Kwoniella dejecticola CBS 10117]